MADPEPKRQDLSGPQHAHLDAAVRNPQTVKEGFVPLGKAARHQAEAGGGSAPLPVAPPRAKTPSAAARTANWPGQGR